MCVQTEYLTNCRGVNLKRLRNELIEKQAQSLSNRNTVKDLDFDATTPSEYSQIYYQRRNRLSEEKYYVWANWISDLFPWYQFERLRNKLIEKQTQSLIETLLQISPIFLPLLGVNIPRYECVCVDWIPTNYRGVNLNYDMNSSRNKPSRLQKHCCSIDFFFSLCSEWILPDILSETKRCMWANWIPATYCRVTYFIRLRNGSFKNRPLQTCDCIDHGWPGKELQHSMGKPKVFDDFS